MHTSEAVISIDCDGFNCLTLTFHCKHGAFIQLHVDINQIFDAHELVEGQIALDKLVLIVLLHSGRVGSLRDDSKRTQLGFLRLLLFEFGHNEGILGQFWLSFLLYRGSHPLNHRWLVDILNSSLELGYSSLAFTCLRMETGLRVSMECPYINSIVLCR